MALHSIPRNAVLNLWWGTSDYAETEQQRPTFVGKPRLSAVNDEYEVAHVAMRFYIAKMTVGATIVFVFIAIVIAAIVVFDRCVSFYFNRCCVIVPIVVCCFFSVCVFLSLLL